MADLLKRLRWCANSGKIDPLEDVLLSDADCREILEALCALAAALECDECAGSGTHVVGGEYDMRAESCPLRDAALALPIVKAILGGER